MKMPGTPQYQTITIGTQSVVLAVPDAAAQQKDYQEQQSRAADPVFPYWSRCWPASMALSAFLLDHPAYILHRNVLELAAGLGLPSLFAARLARRVCASDLIPEAVTLIRDAAERSGIRNLEGSVINWNAPLPLKEVDVLLLSDVNYAPESYERLRQIIRECMEKKIRVILATPQRLQARAFMECLLPWQTAAEQREAGGVMISVWVLG